ncbi:MAG: hypothetical protein AB1333_01220 [Patescibacteria group bacterium]
MTTLIKNGLLYVGTLDAPQKLDVLLQNDRIVRIGSLSKIKADEVIDATGFIVCPGFIDINTHSDHYFSIFSDPLQRDFLKEGITTIIGGNCGESLAPFSLARKGVSTDWGHTQVSSANIHWHDMRELFRVLKNKKFGVNFGTLIGYTTIRNFITGGALRDLTDSEYEMTENILKDALKEGVFGLSTGFEEAHEEHIPYKEISNLIKIVGEKGGVYATHIRNFGDHLGSAVHDVLRVAKETGIKIEISHFIPTKEYSDDYQGAKTLIEQESAMANINFDIPISFERIIPIHRFLPHWIHDEHIEETFIHLHNPRFKKRIMNHFSDLDLKSVVIAVAPKYLSSLVGRSLKEISKSFGMSVGNTLLYLMQISHMTILCAIEDVDKKTLRDFISSPVSIISSASASFSKSEFSSKPRQPIFTSMSAVTKEENIALERLISKHTSIPAVKYGIRERGQIKEGYYADIVIFKDSMAFEVFVNGVHVMKEGVIEDVRGGKTLLKAY